ncbi:hypothetical protein ACUR5C_10320 [Aliikangiella sp. IMCC44653]
MKELSLPLKTFDIFHLSPSQGFESQSEIEDWIPPEVKQQLLKIIKISFKGIDAASYLEKYFYPKDAFKFVLRLYYVDGQSQQIDSSQKSASSKDTGAKMGKDAKSSNCIVGYCLLSFSRAQFTAKSFTCMKASAAFLPAYRNGNNTIAFSLWQPIKHLLMHPFEKVIYLDTILSPAMYRMIAKNVAIYYPNRSEQTPPEVLDLIKQQPYSSNVDFDNLEQQEIAMEEPNPHVVWAGRMSNYSEDEILSLRSSTKSDIQFYCDINPNFDKGYAIVCAVPIGLMQILKTLVKSIFYSKQ